MSAAVSESVRRAQQRPTEPTSIVEPVSAGIINIPQRALTGTALEKELDVYDHGGDEDQINAIIDKADQVLDEPSAGMTGSTGELALHDFAVTLFSDRFKCNMADAIKHAEAFNELNIQPGLARDQVADLVAQAHVYHLLGNQPAPGKSLPLPSFDFNLERGRLSDECFTTKPRERDFVLGELLPAGKVAMLAGFGGVSKTQFAMQAAVDIALGKACALPFAATTPGASLLALGEEDAEEIGRRFGAIAASFNLTPEQRAIIAARVIAFPLTGHDMRLTRQAGYGETRATGLADLIVSAAKRLAIETGLPTRLIVIDHFMLAGDGDPSSPECAIPIMREVEKIAHETGAAVLVLMHSPKSSLASRKGGADDAPDPGAFFGSVAITNKARSGLVLQGMTKPEAKEYGLSEDARHGHVALWIVKNNYGKSNYRAAWLRRETAEGYQVGILRQCTLFAQPKGKKTATDVQAEVSAAAKVLQALRDKPGAFTQRELASTFGTVKRSGLGMHAFRDLLKSMLSTGAIVLREPTAEERKTYGHGGQVKSVVDAAPGESFDIPDFGGANG